MTMSAPISKLRVLVVCPWFFAGDAVGAAARDSVVAIRSLPNVTVSAIGTRNDYLDLDVEIANDLPALLASEVFLSADVIIYHYAVFHEYFNALWLGNGTAQQIVRFHNVTPRRLMPKETWKIIDQSYEQLQAMANADEIWCDSVFNRMTLVEAGLNTDLICVLPLAVRQPPFTTFSAKPKDGPINLLYVGRIAPSKGILDLVEAIGRIDLSALPPFILRIVGNLNFSSSEYARAVNDLIAAHGLGEKIAFVGTVDGSMLESLYLETHILALASYHEGFSVPVGEALRAGAIPITYNAGNLKRMAGGLGRTVQVGNIDELSVALAEVIQDANSARANANAAVLRLDAGTFSAATFTAAAHIHMNEFTFEKLVDRIGARISKLNGI